MVDGESAVLPAPAAFDLDDLAASLLDEPELDETEPSVSRSSRPFTDKDWMDQDHYFDGDLPTDQHGSAEWKDIALSAGRRKPTRTARSATTTSTIIRNFFPPEKRS